MANCTFKKKKKKKKAELRHNIKTHQLESPTTCAFSQSASFSRLFI